MVARTRRKPPEESPVSGFHASHRRTGNETIHRLPKRKARSSLRLAVPCVAALACVGAAGQFVGGEPKHGETKSGAIASTDTNAQPFVPTAAMNVRQALPIAETAPRYRLDDPGRPSIRRRSSQHGSTRPRARGRTVSHRVNSTRRMHPISASPSQRGSTPPVSLFVTIARRAGGRAGTRRRTIRRTRVDRYQVRSARGPWKPTLSGPGTRICTGFSNAGQSGLIPLTPRIDGWLCCSVEPAAGAAGHRLRPGQARSEWPRLPQASKRRIACSRNGRVEGCTPRVAAVPNREAAGETGSISKRRIRHNEAKLRRGDQARP